MQQTFNQRVQPIVCGKVGAPNLLLTRVYPDFCDEINLVRQNHIFFTPPRYWETVPGKYT